MVKATRFKRKTKVKHEKRNTFFFSFLRGRLRACALVGVAGDGVAGVGAAPAALEFDALLPRELRCEEAEVCVHRVPLQHVQGAVQESEERGERVDRRRALAGPFHLHRQKRGERRGQLY